MPSQTPLLVGQKQDLSLRASRAFSPAAPIRQRDVFAGRTQQIERLIDAINQDGQHALIYGERGVGKTSLANVLAQFLALAGQTAIIAPRINCDGTDTFSSVWRKVFARIPVIEPQECFGFGSNLIEEVSRLSDRVGDDLKPDDVVLVACSLAEQNLFIPIIDEFDRLQDSSSARHMTDTIKALSDQCPGTTIVLVGVGDTVQQLIAEHLSVERVLAQVQMPRMSQEELTEIIANGVSALNMLCAEQAGKYITTLSHGLPHYAHLLGLHAVRHTIQDNELVVQVKHVDSAVQSAISGAQQTLRATYHKATMSQRNDALYVQVLLAAVLAETDELGYFAAVDVRSPMSKIMRRTYDIPAFSRHLSEFCVEGHGTVLERIGVPRRYRYRFRNPLLQPYVLMKGLAERLIDRSDIGSFDVNDGRTIAKSGARYLETKSDQAVAQLEKDVAILAVNPTVERTEQACRSFRAAWALFYHDWLLVGRPSETTIQRFRKAYTDCITTLKALAADGSEQSYDIEHYVKSQTWRVRLFERLVDSGPGAIRVELQRLLRDDDV